MTTVIHINQDNIRSNKHREEGNKLPVLRAQFEEIYHTQIKAHKLRGSNTKTLYGDSIHILDEDGGVVASVVYSPDKPLSCGAKVWIETELDILCS